MFTIKYFYQENSGKMTALNNLVEKAEGELIIECDSDDYFVNTAFKVINENCKISDDIYAFAFLKYDQNNCNIGNLFNEEKDTTTMFELYFKEGEDGEKALVFNAGIRKKYKYELEKDEKFITESSMFHRMDKDYKIKGFNIPIMVCEYLNDGYTKNITEVFKKYPYGYYKYFKECLEFNMENVLLKKRLYLIRHYILFSYLTKEKHLIKNVNGTLNKLLTAVLYIPGIIGCKMKGFIRGGNNGKK